MGVPRSFVESTMRRRGIGSSVGWKSSLTRRGTGCSVGADSTVTSAGGTSACSETLSPRRGIDSNGAGSAVVGLGGATNVGPLETGDGLVVTVVDSGSSENGAGGVRPGPVSVGATSRGSGGFCETGSGGAEGCSGTRFTGGTAVLRRAGVDPRRGTGVSSPAVSAEAAGGVKAGTSEGVVRGSVNVGAGGTVLARVSTEGCGPRRLNGLVARGNDRGSFVGTEVDRDAAGYRESGAGCSEPPEPYWRDG